MIILVKLRAIPTRTRRTMPVSLEPMMNRKTMTMMPLLHQKSLHPLLLGDVYGLLPSLLLTKSRTNLVCRSIVQSA